MTKEAPAGTRSARRVSDRQLPAVLIVAVAMPMVPVLFYDFVHPMAPVRMATAGAGLIEGSSWWSMIADLPLPRLEGWPLAAALVGIGAFAFAVYGGAVLVAWRREATRWSLLAVLGPAVVFSAIGALAMPTQSGDIVDYLLSGRVAAVHGASPYEVAPDTYPDDPMLEFASGDYTVDTEEKPPLWIGAAVGLAAVAGDDAPSAVLAFRGAFAALNVANLFLILLVLRRWRPDHLLAGLVLYGWSPVITTHAQAKFDVLMATFALLAAFALVTRRQSLAVGALWSSVLVKVLTLPLLAVLVLGQLRAGLWRRVVLSAAVVLLLTVACYAPFADRPLLVVDHLALTERGGSHLPGPVSALLAIGVIGLVLRVGTASRGRTDPVLQAWALVSLGLVLLVPPGWSWYLITPIAIVSLSGERWRTIGLFGLSGVMFALDTWSRSSSDAFPLPSPDGVSRDTLYVVVLVLGAATGLAAFLATSARRRAAATPGSD